MLLLLALPQEGKPFKFLFKNIILSLALKVKTQQCPVICHDHLHLCMFFSRRCCFHIDSLCGLGYLWEWDIYTRTGDFFCSMWYNKLLVVTWFHLWTTLTNAGIGVLPNILFDFRTNFGILLTSPSSLIDSKLHIFNIFNHFTVYNPLIGWVIS